MPIAPVAGPLLLASLLTLVVPGLTVAGQSPVDLSGTWTIDTYLTDHSEQIARAIGFDTGEYTPEMGGARGEPRGGAPPSQGAEGRTGAPPKQDRAGRGPESQRLSDEDRRLLGELLRPVQFPPLTLKITQGEGAFTVVPGERAPYTMRTDGKTEKHQLEVGTVNRLAEWMGPLLRVEYEVGRAGLLTYTYSRVPTTGQLLIRVNFERLRGQPGPFEVKLVYNRSTAAAVTPN